MINVEYNQIICSVYSTLFLNLDNPDDILFFPIDAVSLFAYC